MAVVLAAAGNCIAGGGGPSVSRFASVTGSMVGGQANAGYEPTGVDMALVPLADNVYYAPGAPGMATENEGFISNAGVVVTPAGVVVFDALGTPSLGQRLRAEIRKITPLPVVKVVVSHYHADHIYGLQVFQDEGAEIIAPAGAATYLESDGALARLKERRETLFPWVDENSRLVEPDVLVQDRLAFSLGGYQFDLRVLGATHSEGDLVMQVGPAGVLFVGDIIFEGRIPFVAGAEPEHWLAELQALDAGKLTAIVPGHGPVAASPTLAVTFTRDYMQHLYAAMKAGVDELMTFEEAYERADWSRYAPMPAFAAHRVNANYLFLRLEAQSLKR